MRKKRLYVLLFLLICIIGLGYAFLSINLTINGTADVSANTWNVHFANIQTTTGSVTPTVAPTLNGDSTSTSFTVLLDEPGDFYEFTIDVVNAGTIDAMLNTIIPGSLTPEQAKYLDYTITYSDGVVISKNDLLSSGSTETIKVRIEFKQDITSTDLPSSDIEITLAPAIHYIQNDGGIAVYHSNMYLSDSDSNGLIDIGDIITIDTERFYVISNDGTNVKALAEWNLLVGNYCTGYDSSKCSTLTSPSGLQVSSARGYILAGFPFYGTTPFASSSYWTGTDGEIIDLNNSSNLVNSYLNSYKTSLIAKGGRTSDISLITKDELISLGCDISTNTCNSTYSWIYNTTYWTRTAYSSGDIWNVASHNFFGHNSYSRFADVGVRPVITISVNDIK